MDIFSESASKTVFDLKKWFRYFFIMIGILGVLEQDWATCDTMFSLYKNSRTYSQKLLKLEIKIIFIYFCNVFAILDNFFNFENYIAISSFSMWIRTILCRNYSKHISCRCCLQRRFQFVFNNIIVLVLLK